MISAAVCWPGIMSYFGRAIRPHLAGHYVFTGRISVQTAVSKIISELLFREYVKRIGYMIVYLGTWGFFKPEYKKNNINDMLKFAVDNGITHFDTAYVYGNGEAEKALGAINHEGVFITTKIPGMIKPGLNTPITLSYTAEWIRECASVSYQRLNKIDTLLLHNWSPGFHDTKEVISVIDALEEFKQFGLCRQIGISLPNGFSGDICQYAKEKADIFMLPFNENNMWAPKFIDEFVDSGKHVLLRSIFSGGDRSPSSVDHIIERIMHFRGEVDLVVGATSEQHIQYWGKINGHK